MIRITTQSMHGKAHSYPKSRVTGGENCMQKSKFDHKLMQICRDELAEKTGDISFLPPKLINHALRVYCEFISGYLNILRQKEGKSMDWFPDSVTIDFSIVNDMRHFFSDYQHITKEFLSLRDKMDELIKIDKGKHPKLFQHKVDQILVQARDTIEIN